MTPTPITSGAPLSATPIIPDKFPICLNNEFGAPAHATTDDSTSAKEAIEYFCSANKGFPLKKGTDPDPLYQRWGISVLGVPDRQSLWIRASAEWCDEGELDEQDCTDKLKHGVSYCDPESDSTHGFEIQGKNCIVYSLQTSDSTHEGDPPWNPHVISYPPPETAMMNFTEGETPARFNVSCSGDELPGDLYPIDQVQDLVNRVCGCTTPDGGPCPYPGDEDEETIYASHDENVWLTAYERNWDWTEDGYCL
jgi:hypothetical protein